jgi:hypothetical protein
LRIVSIRRRVRADTDRRVRATPPTPPAPPPPAAPLVTTGAAATALRTIPSPPVPENPAGGSGSVAGASQVLEGIRTLCPLLENDGKLFAACDNTAPGAKIKSAATYLPQLGTEWEEFTKRIVDADFIVKGKRRPVVVWNNGVVMAESSAGGVIKLRK